VKRFSEIFRFSLPDASDTNYVTHIDVKQQMSRIRPASTLLQTFLLSCIYIHTSFYLFVAFGDVVDSVIAIYLKVRGFKPDRGR
jgi:hypothetical protein